MNAELSVCVKAKLSVCEGRVRGLLDASCWTVISGMAHLPVEAG